MRVVIHATAAPTMPSAPTPAIDALDQPHRVVRAQAVDGGDSSTPTHSAKDEA